VEGERKKRVSCEVFWEKKGTIAKAEKVGKKGKREKKDVLTISQEKKEGGKVGFGFFCGGGGGERKRDSTLPIEERGGGWELNRRYRPTPCGDEKGRGGSFNFGGKKRKKELRSQKGREGKKKKEVRSRRGSAEGRGKRKSLLSLPKRRETYTKKEDKKGEEKKKVEVLYRGRKKPLLWLYTFRKKEYSEGKEKRKKAANRHASQ